MCELATGWNKIHIKSERPTLTQPVPSSIVVAKTRGAFVVSASMTKACLIAKTTHCRIPGKRWKTLSR
jgi:hypothetical protein